MKNLVYALLGVLTALCIVAVITGVYSARTLHFLESRNPFTPETTLVILLDQCEANLPRNTYCIITISTPEELCNNN